MTRRRTVLVGLVLLVGCSSEASPRSAPPLAHVHLAGRVEQVVTDDRGQTWFLQVGTVCRLRGGDLTCARLPGDGKNTAETSSGRTLLQPAAGAVPVVCTRERWGTDGIEVVYRRAFTWDELARDDDDCARGVAWSDGSIWVWTSGSFVEHTRTSERPIAIAQAQHAEVVIDPEGVWWQKDDHLFAAPLSKEAIETVRGLPAAMAGRTAPQCRSGNNYLFRSRRDPDDASTNDLVLVDGTTGRVTATSSLSDSSSATPWCRSAMQGLLSASDENAAVEGVACSVGSCARVTRVSMGRDRMLLYGAAGILDTGIVYVRRHKPTGDVRIALADVGGIRETRSYLEPEYHFTGGFDLTPIPEGAILSGGALVVLDQQGQPVPLTLTWLDGAE